MADGRGYPMDAGLLRRIKSQRAGFLKKILNKKYVCVYFGFASRILPDPVSVKVPYGAKLRAFRERGAPLSRDLSLCT